jgi:hypothetical protein
MQLFVPFRIFFRGGWSNPMVDPGELMLGGRNNY